MKEIDINPELDNKLTEAITQFDIKQDNESFSKCLDILLEMWKNNIHVWLPVSYIQDSNKKEIVIGSEPTFGKYILFYSDPHFLDKEFMDELVFTNIRDVFNDLVVSEEYESCRGIIINPLVHNCQLPVDKKHVRDIIKQGIMDESPDIREFFYKLAEKK